MSNFLQKDAEKIRRSLYRKGLKVSIGEIRNMCENSHDYESGSRMSKTEISEIEEYFLGSENQLTTATGTESNLETVEEKSVENSNLAIKEESRIVENSPSGIVQHIINQSDERIEDDVKGKLANVIQKTFNENLTIEQNLEHVYQVLESQKQEIIIKFLRSLRENDRQISTGLNEYTKRLGESTRKTQDMFDDLLKEISQ